MNIISDCPLCEAHGLHVVGEREDQILQCLNCGYVSSGKFVCDNMKDNDLYKELPQDMRGWAKETEGRFWIPTMITLPFGMLYPLNDKDNNMIWALAKLADISEEEKEQYPKEDGNGFYDKRFDTENVEEYDVFLEAMAEVNKIAKEAKPEESESILPKLERID